jgi:hypothetical protein
MEHIEVVFLGFNQQRRIADISGVELRSTFFSSSNISTALNDNTKVVCLSHGSFGQLLFTWNPE